MSGRRPWAAEEEAAGRPGGRLGGPEGGPWCFGQCWLHLSTISKLASSCVWASATGTATSVTTLETLVFRRVSARFGFPESICFLSGVGLLRRPLGACQHTHTHTPGTKQQMERATFASKENGPRQLGYPRHSPEGECDAGYATPAAVEKAAERAGCRGPARETGPVGSQMALRWGSDKEPSSNSVASVSFTYIRRYAVRPGGEGGLHSGARFGSVLVRFCFVCLAFGSFGFASVGKLLARLGSLLARFLARLGA